MGVERLTLENEETGGRFTATRLEHERVYTEAKGWRVVNTTEPSSPDGDPDDDFEALTALAALPPEDLELLELLDDDELADLAALTDQEA